MFGFWIMILDKDCLMGLKVFSGSRYVLANLNEHSWSCVFGLDWVRSGFELGLGLRKRVHLSLDLGG